MGSVTKGLGFGFGGCFGILCAIAGALIAFAVALIMLGALS